MASRLGDNEFVQRDTVSRAQDIYSQALECKDLFSKYLKMPSVYATQVSVCQRQFLTWTNFLGVFASESTSLDRRLEFNPEFKELVMSMLRVLKRNLERGLVRHALVHPSRGKIEVVEDDGVMYGINGAVDRLQRLAVAIRHSPRTDEVERVRNFASKQKPDDFPSVLSAMMQFLFPDIERTLQVQLVESIIYRRHRMLWNRRHSKKLGQLRKTEDDSQPTKEEPATAISGDSSRKNVLDHGAQSRRSPRIEPESVYSSTLPSRRPMGKKHRNLFRVQQEGQQEDIRSARSSNPPPRAQYPELPNVPMSETRLSCPYCLSDIEFPLNATKAERETIWVTHLNADLQPYVCVSEECRHFPTAFSSTKEWKAHMNENHGAEWARYIHRLKWSCQYCDDDDAGFFSSEELLGRHLTQKHPNAADAFELAKIKLKGRVSNPRPANQCPLCGPPPWNNPRKMSKEIDASGSTPDDLNIHFISHLQHLALLSISWWDADVGAVPATPDSGCGSTNPVRFNSEIDGNQNEKMDTLFLLDDDALEELETTRSNLEFQGQAYQDELVEQQKQLWEKLRLSLNDTVLAECRELRSKLEWSDEVHQAELLNRLEYSYQQLQSEAETVMPQEARLELISKHRVEPPHCDPAASSRQWLEVELYRSLSGNNSSAVGDTKNMLEWLSSTNYPAQQSDIIARRESGTGEWLLDTPQMASWLSKPQATLFCPGIPGAGKTMVAAIVVDFLLKSVQSSSHGVAYVYCNIKAPEEQKVSKILAAVLKQLVQAEPLLVELVERLHSQHADKGTRPSPNEIFSTLQDAFSHYSTVFIVVDALDELQDNDNTLSQFLAKLRDLRSRQDVRLMVTSRCIPRIEHEFEKAFKLEVRASREDVERFVAGQLSRMPKSIQRDAALQKLAQEKIVEAVDGMFLLARLYINSLRDKIKPKSVRSALANLPNGSGALDEVYRAAIRRIEQQSEEHSQLARQVLSWITCAKRSLTTEEICCALAVEPDKAKLCTENIPDVEDLLSTCAGLVVVDQESGIIRLVHRSTQEYFQRIQDTWDPDAQLRIATTCLTYLSFDIFKTGSCSSYEEFEQRLQEYRFLDYAAKYWGEHVAKVEDQIYELASSLLSHKKLVSSAAQVLLRPMYYLSDNQRLLKDTMSTGLHLAAQFGLSVAAEFLLANQEEEQVKPLEKMDNYDRTVLYLAAQYGHQNMVMLLLDAGADINTQGGQYGNALQAASYGGHEQVVMLLLNAGADVNAQSGQYGSALQAASGQGYERIVKLLINAGANINAQEGLYGSALQVASERGHEQIVTLLRNRSGPLNSTTDPAHSHQPTRSKIWRWICCNCGGDNSYMTDKGCAACCNHWRDSTCMLYNMNVR